MRSGGFSPDSLDKSHTPNNIGRLRGAPATRLVFRGASRQSEHDRQAVHLP
jgi:hypothetical protein